MEGQVLTLLDEGFLVRFVVVVVFVWDLEIYMDREQLVEVGSRVVSLFFWIPGVRFGSRVIMGREKVGEGNDRFWMCIYM